MSWWFCMEIDVGGEHPATVRNDVNVTYNVAPMYHEAFGEGGIRGLHGLTGKEAEPLVQKAIRDMYENPEKYKKMTPVNGWGSYEGALKALYTLHEWTRECPKATVGIH